MWYGKYLTRVLASSRGIGQSRLWLLRRVYLAEYRNDECNDCIEHRDHQTTVLERLLMWKENSSRFAILWAKCIVYGSGRRHQEVKASSVEKPKFPR